MRSWIGIRAMLADLPEDLRLAFTRIDDHLHELTAGLTLLDQGKSITMRRLDTVSGVNDGGGGTISPPPPQLDTLTYTFTTSGDTTQSNDVTLSIGGVTRSPTGSWLVSSSVAMGSGSVLGHVYATITYTDYNHQTRVIQLFEISKGSTDPAALTTTYSIGAAFDGLTVPVIAFGSSSNSRSLTATVTLTKIPDPSPTPLPPWKERR